MVRTNALFRKCLEGRRMSWCWVTAEQDNPLPFLAGDAVPDVPQDMGAILAARALLTHVQVAINQDPQISSHDTAFQPPAP